MINKLPWTSVLIALILMLAMNLPAGAGVRADRECTLKHSNPNTIDWPDDYLDSDWSDEPFTPSADHLYQHYEWLGTTVDQESMVNNPDDNATGIQADNDGLVSARIDAAKGAVELKFDVSTSFSAHPEAYPAATREFVEAWVDWDKDNIFEPAERVGLGWSSSPLAWGGTDNHTGTILGLAAGPPDNYNVRLRLYWAHSQLPAQPGGSIEWGEVEDYEQYDFIAEDLPGPGYGQVNVPSLSTWGLIILVLLLLAAAAWVFLRKRAGGIA